MPTSGEGLPDGEPGGAVGPWTRPTAASRRCWALSCPSYKRDLWSADQLESTPEGRAASLAHHLSSGELRWAVGIFSTRPLGVGVGETLRLQALS